MYLYICVFKAISAYLYMCVFAYLYICIFAYIFHYLCILHICTFQYLCIFYFVYFSICVIVFVYLCILYFVCKNSRAPGRQRRAASADELRNEHQSPGVFNLIKFNFIKFSLLWATLNAEMSSLTEARTN